MTEPLAGLGVAAEPPPIGAALEGELARLAPVAPRHPGRQLALIAAASIGWALAVAGLLSIRGDLGDLPRTWLIVYLAAWLCGFLAPMVLIVIPRRGTMLPRWRLAALVAALAAVGFVVGGLTLARRAPTSLERGLAAGHLCLSGGLATALVPVLLAVLALRGAIPNASRRSAAAIGAGAGCIGGFMLHLHCPIADGVHVGVVHGGVVAVSALLAALLAPRFLAPR